MSRRAEHAVWEARNARVATGLAPLLVLTASRCRPTWLC